MENSEINVVRIYPISPSWELPDVKDVGLKGLNLIRMRKIGLPIPEGFVICSPAYFDSISDKDLPDELQQAIRESMSALEKATGLAFGGRRPLLVSVRSSAAVSMPGMLATVPDIGICDSTVNEMIRMTGNPSAVWDCYRRLIQSYAEVVLSYKGGRFDKISRQLKNSERVKREADLSAMSLKNLVCDYLKAFEEETNRPFPQEPMSQLSEAIKAVFMSWANSKAATYRTLQKIRELKGTAVIVQRMVFGNMGATSGSGVAFTRDPATGEKRLYLDFLFNAQGDDIVSGASSLQSAEQFKAVLPRIYSELDKIGSRLELDYKDMQDLEFTIQQGNLFVLQCRNGKRTSWAAVKIAVDLVEEGVIDKDTALDRLSGLDLELIEKNVIVKTPELQSVAKGVPAGPGVAVGKVALDSEMIKSILASGSNAILVRDAISTGDIPGIAACSGVLTSLGGRTSHAALLAREMNKVCIVGCSGLTSISTEKRTIAFGTRIVCEGDEISIDGNSGDVYIGRVKISTQKLPELEIVRRWRETAEKEGWF